MANLVAFLNSFLSYLLLFGVCVVVVIVAVTIGITLRKKKNAEEELAAKQAENDQAAANA